MTFQIVAHEPNELVRIRSGTRPKAGSAPSVARQGGGGTERADAYPRPGATADVGRKLGVLLPDVARMPWRSEMEPAALRLLSVGGLGSADRRFAVEPAA